MILLHIGQHPYLLSLRPDGFNQSLTVLTTFVFYQF